MIKQLERVADAGLGDVTKVASAQSALFPCGTDRNFWSAEKSRIDFINSFGLLPQDIDFDAHFDNQFIAKGNIRGNGQQFAGD